MLGYRRYSPFWRLQCVVQALKLLHGDNAVLPTLRAAAEHYHAQQAAPINELAELLAQVSIAADQVRKPERQCFKPPHRQMPAPHGAGGDMAIASIASVSHAWHCKLLQGQLLDAWRSLCTAVRQLGCRCAQPQHAWCACVPFRP